MLGGFVTLCTSQISLVSCGSITTMPIGFLLNRKYQPFLTLTRQGGLEIIPNIQSENPPFGGHVDDQNYTQAIKEDLNFY